MKSKYSNGLSRQYQDGKARGRRRVSALRGRNLPKHPFVVPLITFLVLFSASAVGFVLWSSRGQTLRPQDSHVTIVSYDKKQQTIPTRANNVGEVLERLNITLATGDVVEPAKETPIVEDNFRVNVYRARPVTIIDSGHKVLAFNAATTPRSIAAGAGVTVYPEDKVDLAPADNILQEGISQKMTIDRATPVTLVLYGNPVSVRTHSKTVEDLLREKDVKLESGDTVLPDTKTALVGNTQILINRSGTQTAIREEPIPFETQTVEDPSLSFGATAVRQAGVAGKRIVTYQIELQNGKEVSRKQIQSVVSQEPVKQIMARGKAVEIPGDTSAVMAAAGIAPSDYAYVNYIVSRESGWCPTKWQGQRNCPSYYVPLHDPSSGYGYGLCQSTPAIKMSTAGGDWQTNPVTQLRWCSNYANRYGGWAGAYAKWTTQNWW